MRKFFDSSQRFSIIVLSSHTSTERQYSLPVWAVRLAGIASIAMCLLFGYLSVYFTQTWGFADRIQSLVETNETMYSAKIKLEDTITSLSKSQKMVEDRITKLATIVGVEGLPEASENAIGGAGGLDNPWADSNATQVEKDIAEVESRHSLFSFELAELERLYAEKTNLLNYVPSIWPVDGVLTNGYGWRKDPFTRKPDFHEALDISARTGTSIYAPADGVVTQVKRSSGFGNIIVLSHGYGYVTRYGHLQSFKVKKGQRIKRGDEIGLVGSTGRSTGPHLHYELLVNNKKTDPRRYIMSEARTF